MAGVLGIEPRSKVLETFILTVVLYPCTVTILSQEASLRKMRAQVVQWLCMKVVIVGGGFGGVKAAIELAKKKIGPITLISDRDYFFHHGLLYSTATGSDPKESAIPIRDILKPYSEIHFFVDEITKISVREQKVYGAKKSYLYDQLVLAVGMSEYFYGIDGARRYSYSLDSLEGVKKFSADFHDRVLDESHELHCAIIGGGPTGVELAGHLTQYAEKIAKAHAIAHSGVNIMILERAERLLPGLSRAASLKVTRKLRQIGVRVRAGHTIDKVARSYIVADSARMNVDMAVWTCGGRINSLFERHSEVFHISEHGRVVVNQYLEAYPRIFVIGDSADAPNSGYASGAVAHAQFLARHLDRIVRGTQLRPFSSAVKPLTSLPISRFWAYSERYGIYASGVLGSVIRRIAELNSYCYLVSFDKAWKLWRRHRRSNEICRFCRRNVHIGKKSLAKA